jgi:hypothetical protein
VLLDVAIERGTRREESVIGAPMSAFNSPVRSFATTAGNHVSHVVAVVSRHIATGFLDFVDEAASIRRGNDQNSFSVLWDALGSKFA